MQRVAEVGDTNALHAGEVVACAAFGNVLPVSDTVLNKRGEQRDRRPIAMADIADVAAFHHQLNVVLDFMANACQQAVVANLLIAFVLQHDDFHHLQQVEHRNVVQPVGAARNRQLHAADHRVIAGIFQRHAAVEKRGHHHFIVKNLWNTGA